MEEVAEKVAGLVEGQGAPEREGGKACWAGAGVEGAQAVSSKCVVCNKGSFGSRWTKGR